MLNFCKKWKFGVKNWELRLLLKFPWHITPNSNKAVFFPSNHLKYFTFFRVVYGEVSPAKERAITTRIKNKHSRKTEMQIRAFTMISSSFFNIIYICHFYLYHKRIYGFILMFNSYMNGVCSAHTIHVDVASVNKKWKPNKREEKKKNSRVLHFLCYSALTS